MASARPWLPADTASQPVKVTVPKSASGRIVRDEGASMTHSAEARAAVAVVV